MTRILVNAKLHRLRAAGHLDSGDRAGRRRPLALSARQRQLAHGAVAADWMHSSGIAQRVLADVCAAVEITIEWEVGTSRKWARRVIERFPVVRGKCDRLRFSNPAQGLAYFTCPTVTAIIAEWSFEPPVRAEME